jgi:hypothetical protein
MYCPYREKGDQQHVISNNIIQMEIACAHANNHSIPLVSVLKISELEDLFYHP